MTIAKIDLELYQGATFRKGFTYKNRLKKPYDLTGFGARMQIRDASDALIADLNTDNGGITLGGLAGTIDLYLSDEATAALNFAKASYDLFLDAPNGDAIPLMAGNVTLTKGRTRA